MQASLVFRLNKSGGFGIASLVRVIGNVDPLPSQASSGFLLLAAHRDALPLGGIVLDLNVWSNDTGIMSTCSKRLYGTGSKVALIEIFMCLLASVFPCHAAKPPMPTPPPGVKVLRDIVYVQRGEKALKLDLYLPADQTSPRPLAIWIHGGGWRKGSKNEWVNPLFLTSRGFAVASIQYRLSFQAIFPSQIEDCKAAVRFLRANAGVHGLDPERFAAIGESAGGNLASLLGTTGGLKELSDAPESPVSDRVQAVIDLFGPADLTAIPDDEQPDSASFFDDKLLGGTPGQRPDLARAASPIYHISSETPPFLILHGKGDPLVPSAQSEMFFAALQKAGIPSELVIVPVSYHAGPGFWTETMQDKMVLFLDKTLRIPQAP